MQKCPRVRIKKKKERRQHLVRAPALSPGVPAGMEAAGQSREEVSAQTPSSCPNRVRRKGSLSGTAGLAGQEGQVARGSRDVSSPQEPCFPLRNMISKSPFIFQSQRRRSRACRAKQRGRSLSSLAKDLLLRVLAITSYSIPESIQRLNNAPVAGYEGDVGSKTTMRLFYPESAHFNPKVENNPDTLLVLVAFKAMDFHWIETILSDKKRVRKGFWKQPPLIWDVNPKQIRILNPFFMEIAADKLLSLPMQQPRKMKQKPTTGLVAITLALHLCDVVHIAGFGYPDAHNRKQTIHYYEQITLKSMAGSGHNVSQEALAIKRMLGMGAVRNLTYF
ncbi:CMP-N-acetylneuraminate-beta-galactosamide-alpha-2,3-sialyltransferase 4 isoform 26-T30 [Molossus nigricans]